MISFKAAQFPRDVTSFAVLFYMRYTVSYRGLEELIEERGVCVGQSCATYVTAPCARGIVELSRRVVGC